MGGLLYSRGVGRMNDSYKELEALLKKVLNNCYTDIQLKEETESCNMIFKRTPKKGVEESERTS